MRNRAPWRSWSLRSPGRQGALCGSRIILDAVDGLPAELSGLRYFADIRVLTDHVLYETELSSRKAQLAAAISFAVSLGVINTGSLGLFDGFCLRLGRRPLDQGEESAASGHDPGHGGARCQSPEDTHWGKRKLKRDQ